MNKEIEQKLAASLTSKKVDILPYIPYFLQDFWELGSSPRDIVYLIEKYIEINNQSKFLDLACGKGAVSIAIAKKIAAEVRGVDIIPEFIEEAKAMAKKEQISSLCSFEIGDVNEMIQKEKEYDGVIFGAAADILGTPDVTLKKLRTTIKDGGYIIIDEAYLPDTLDNSDIKYHNYEYLRREQWLKLFKKNNLTLVEELEGTEKENHEQEKYQLINRAKQLCNKFPEKREVFEEYLRSQLSEYEDLDQRLIAVTWILQKK